MFFPERIRNIKDGDRVLEIGPGSSPFPRANVLLELRYDSEATYKLQCGDDGMKAPDVRTVFYDGKTFPFDDKEFDYVICSHVLEHVEDVKGFCAEVFRVGKAGYFEYPLYYYEYVYDIPAHCTLLKFTGGEIVYLPKSELLSDVNEGVRKFWYATLNAGHTAIVRNLIDHIMEGFEWSEPLKVRRAANPKELCHENIDLASLVPKPQRTNSARSVGMRALRAIKNILLLRMR